MQFAIHRSRIRPPLRVEVQFTLLGHVEEVHHEHVQRQFLLAIFLGHIENLILSRIDRLALDVPISRLRQHLCHAGEQAVTFIDFVAGLSGDNEIGNAISYLGRPRIAPIEPQIDRRFGWVIPHQAIATA